MWCGWVFVLKGNEKMLRIGLCKMVLSLCVYAKIKVPKTSPTAKYTLHKAQKMRIKDELKCLYAKKQQLNRQIYHLHILLANTWGSSWPYIHHTIEEKLKNPLQPKYKNLDNKLNKLAQTQTDTDRYPHILPKSCKQDKHLVLEQ